MPYETEDWIHLENPAHSEEDFRKTEAGKVNVVGTINLGRGIQARMALLKGPGDKTDIYVYLFSKKPPYSWTMGKATEWLEAHKQAVFSFDYLAVFEPLERNIAKIYVIDTLLNRNKWQVTDEALQRALNSLIGKPLLAYPDHSGTVEVGRFIDAFKTDGHAIGLAEISDPNAWENIVSGRWRFVSPQVLAYDVSDLDGMSLLKGFAFEHVAFVPEGAYPNAQVLSTFSGQESGLRTFSVALTKSLEERKTSQQAPFKAGAIPFKEGPKAPEDESWDFNAADYDAEQLYRACAWYDSEDPENKGSYKLPHHRPDGTVVWRGVAAAMAALMGGRGGVDIPSDDQKGVYNHLVGHYRQFDKEPPEFEGTVTKPKGEIRKMSEKAHDEEPTEASTWIVENAKLKGQIEKLQRDNQELADRLAKLEAERHDAKVQQLLGLRASVGLEPTKADIEKFTAMSDDMLNQLIADASELKDREVYMGAPKTKYTGDQILSAEDKVRLRLIGRLKPEVK